jgi:hypothetical protein
LHALCSHLATRLLAAIALWTPLPTITPFSVHHFLLGRSQLASVTKKRKTKRKRRGRRRRRGRVRLVALSRSSGCASFNTIDITHFHLSLFRILHHFHYHPRLGLLRLLLSDEGAVSLCRPRKQLLIQVLERLRDSPAPPFDYIFIVIPNLRHFSLVIRSSLFIKRSLAFNLLLLLFFFFFSSSFT